MRFKVGDKVRFSSSPYASSYTISAVATLKAKAPNGNWTIETDMAQLISKHYWYKSIDLFPVEEKPKSPVPVPLGYGAMTTAVQDIERRVTKLEQFANPNLYYVPPAHIQGHWSGSW